MSLFTPTQPPMGWNSWNCFGVDVREADVLAAAEYLARHLRPCGWEYVVIDMGWYLGPGITTANFKQPRPPQRVDAHGRLWPSEEKFPSARDGRGFTALADRLHALGLKFGLHFMRGIPWQAVEDDRPVLGSDWRARAIADAAQPCPWYGGNLGLRVEGGGALAYYRSVVGLCAEWGVDFIKVDDMSFPYRAGEIEAFSQAVKEVDRPIVLSLSPGPSPVGQCSDLSRRATMWRISADFWDDWRLLHRQFGLCRAWQDRLAPGTWPDADMLPLGRLRITGPDDYSVGEMGLAAEEITNEYSRFNDDEKLSLGVLWAMFRSPLFIGGFLPDSDEQTRRLITQPDLLALNQHGCDNREIYFDDTASVWTATDARTGTRYLAVFNLRDPGVPPRHEPRWCDLGVLQATDAVEVWTGRSATLEPLDTATDDVSPHGVALWRLSGAVAPAGPA